MSERLLMIGGSVRAAAMSARRAGFEPLAIDRFADRDLREVCDEWRQFNAIEQLPELSGQLPQSDWIYAGPLENHTDLIEQVTHMRPLLGNRGTQLCQLRNPDSVASALQDAGLLFPEVCHRVELPVGGDWLEKPLHSAGGFGIKRILEPHASRDETSYCQKFVPGVSVGATFIGADGRAALVGIAEQLFGPTWDGSREFQYVGSVGPIVLPPQHLQAIKDIGNCIAAEFLVSGLFGIDAIVNDEGVWAVEVNPRYTASVEILERTLDVSTIGLHIDACRDGALPSKPANSHTYCLGKAVLYATGSFVIDEAIEHELFERRGELTDPMIADIPIAGTSVERGDPIVTVFAMDTTIHATKVALRKAMIALQGAFDRLT
jgi:uncharacterized protein